MRPALSGGKQSVLFQLLLPPFLLLPTESPGEMWLAASVAKIKMMAW